MFSFSNRVVSIWNSLPDYVVSACSVVDFESHLDYFWRDLECLREWKASLSGIGSRTFVWCHLSFKVKLLRCGLRGLPCPLFDVVVVVLCLVKDGLELHHHSIFHDSMMDGSILHSIWLTWVQHYQWINQLTTRRFSRFTAFIYFYIKSLSGTIRFSH